MGVVTVYLDKIANLRDEDLIGKSDPYVKFELEQDGWIYDKTIGKHQSTKKKNDLNPVYGETFVFEDVPKIKDMKLKIKVLDEDILIDDSLGGCEINLDTLGLSADTPTEVNKIIDARTDKKWFTDKATIYLQITYKE